MIKVQPIHKKVQVTWVAPLLFVFLFAGLFAALAINTSIITIVLIVLCLWSLVGKVQAIQALSLSVIIKYLNPGIYSLPPEAGFLSWLILLLVGLRVLPSLRLRHMRVIGPLLLFSSIVAGLAFIVSATPLISLLKLFAFTFATATIIVAFEEYSSLELYQMKIWFFSLICAVILLSLPVFLFPSIAYLRNNSGFQGILNHPQAFGAFLAPVASWLLAVIVFKSKNKNVILIIVTVIIFALIILSETRTAAFAVILSIIVAFLVNLNRKYNDPDTALSRTVFFGILILFLASLVSVFSPNIVNMLSNTVHEFIFKRDATDLKQSFYVSRGAGIENQWKNFLDSPLTGHGFGIYPSGYIPVGVTTFMGIPISAPVEKGFIPTAILEETGVIGTVLFLLFLGILFKQLVKNRDVRWTAMFFGCLFINFGEAVIFSVGGIGLHYWMLIGLSIYANNKKELK